MRTPVRRPAPIRARAEEPDPFGDGKGPDPLDYIPAVTTRNVLEMPFDDFLEALRPYLLERVPEGVLGQPSDVMMEVDRLIGRFANVYAYLSVLLAYVWAKAREVKSTDKAEFERRMAKKEALYRFCRSVELKWQASSRQVTVETESELDFERPAYGARSERSREHKPQAAGRTKGWGAV